MRQYLLLLSIILVQVVFGQATAEKVLAAAGSKLQEAPALSAKFSATAEGTTVAGEMMLSQARFKMSTSDYSVWYDGVDMWCYYKKSNETYISFPSEEELLEINPFVILNNYKNNYQAKLLQEKGGQYYVQLTPYAKNAQIIKAVLEIEKSTSLPTNVTVTFANGANVKIDILSVSILNTVPKLSTFQYQKTNYPNVEIIDLR